MGKKAWIVFGVICVVVVATALVLMLVLVPQAKSTGIQASAYEPVAKQDYTFDGSEIEQLKKQYTITSKDVKEGKKTNKYEEGNINPFTPSKDVTIYNEPTIKNEPTNGSGTLTPDSK